MLKFLQNRKDQQLPRKTIRDRPYITFGISLQTPQTFQKQFTMMNKNTFVNPYLPMEDRKNSVPFKKRVQISPKWTRKINLNLIQERKILANTLEVQNNYRASYQKQYQRDKSRFRITKGQFKSFIERGSRYNSIAPVDGNQRNMDRALQTKKSVIQKSLQSIHKSTKTRLSNIDSLGRLSISNRNSPLKMKFLIRKTRQSFYNGRNAQSQMRRNTKYEGFALPEVAKKIKRQAINNIQMKAYSLMNTIQNQS